MQNTLTQKLFLGCATALCCWSLCAQQFEAGLTFEDATKRLHNFEELKSMGYSEKEIYEDLGNANFLSQNYETALFWYEKLLAFTEDGILDGNYQKRYDYAVSKIGQQQNDNEEDDENWTELVREDYQMTDASLKSNVSNSNRRNFRPLNFTTANNELAVNEVRKSGKADYKVLKTADLKNMPNQKNYESPISITSDGNTAYFSKSTYVKPTYGLFSKKQLLHKIYKADKVDGEWKTIKELKLCPNDYSALHPTISEDGKRLFFASNMPGSFGEYDIYVSNIQSNGAAGIAKNLGNKVNTDKNDLYPKLMEGNTLVFASEGHKGYGGLDVYIVEVAQNKVGLAMNLGNPINSKEDDLSIQFLSKNGMDYIVSTRGKEGRSTQKVAFSYSNNRNPTKEKDYRLLEALNTGVQMDYSSSVFEDEQ
ncbi:cell envelope biogenesis protein OmpA [Maribacter aestuarii]|uniref:cell envelope biogenesis protein OmpA n=1 Tax=Maribacter aestuarii TaxID=1130723 RepID=UPI00248ACCD0|nr:cell envelope biogenesis protein OmpA [Maribacter aestuarii]